MARFRLPEKQRRWTVVALCVVIAAASVALLPRVRGGELVFLLCFVGAAGTLYKELAPRRA